MANDRTSWTDPKTGREVRVGDTWQDAKPIYRAVRFPLRTVKIGAITEERVMGASYVRIQYVTDDVTWKGRLRRGHLVNILGYSFVKRFTLVSRAPDATLADPNALKPCPFCGAVDGKVGNVDGGAAAQCWTCAAQGPLGTGGETEARRLWNTRAEVSRG